MKLETAYKLIDKQAEFLGMTRKEVMEDIYEHGKMLYNEKTVEALEVVFIYNQVMKGI
jgi:hypothetical protein